MGEPQNECIRGGAVTEDFIYKSIDQIHPKITEHQFAIFMGLAAPFVKDHKKDEIHPSGIELRWVAWGGHLMTVTVLDESGRPRQVARRTVTTAIQKTANAPNSVANCKARRRQIAEFEKRKFVFSAVKPYVERATRDSTMNRNSTGPNSKNIHWVLPEFGQIKQDIKSSSADNAAYEHAEGDIKDMIGSDEARFIWIVANISFASLGRRIPQRQHEPN